jgi:Raf kinase inhibitor-like YbhB/YbcL family protein
VNLLLALILLSSAFQNGGPLPKTAAAMPCGGSGVSPALQWSGAPPNTRSFALIVHDPDAPVAGGFYHWVLYDVPAQTSELATSARVPGNRSGRNSYGTIGYGGACPPPGNAHHYRFTLYALDIPSVHATQPLTATELLARMQGHILAQTTLVGMFAVAPR